MGQEGGANCGPGGAAKSAPPQQGRDGRGGKTREVLRVGVGGSLRQEEGRQKGSQKDGERFRAGIGGGLG